MTGERMSLVAWRPLVKGSLRGFATVRLPIGMVIRDCPVNESHGKFWAGLPAKPQIDREGRILRDDRGKTAYTAVLEWESRKLRDAFSDRVIELVRERDPTAFKTASVNVGAA
jgi:hypothetical protein